MTEIRAACWRLLLPVVVLATGCGSTCGGRAGDEKPPSVILISIDTLRADKLGCYGYSLRETSPNIDALASDGVLFESFITSSPWTTPAHLTMLTSLYPSTHGLTASFKEIKSDIQRKGKHRFYRLPERRVTLAEALAGAGFSTAAFTGGGTVAPILGFDQGFARYEENMYKVDQQNMAQLVKWIGEQRGKRFFLFWHTFEVHAPYLDTRFVTDVVPGEYGKKLVAELLTEVGEPRGDHDPLGKHATSQRYTQKRVLRDYGLFRAKVCEALYVGGVRSMDSWIGELVKYLREAGLYDEVMIVVTSDHGEEFAERDEDEFYDRHGHTLYEEQVHVPLVVKLPGQRHAGTRVRDVTRMVDLMPTILDVAGATSPRAAEMEGVSLRGHWERDLGRPRTSPAFSEALAQPHEKKSLREQRYKFIISAAESFVQRHGRGALPKSPSRVELYDLEADPQERRNLLASGAEGDVSRTAFELDRLLREFAAGEQGEVEPAELDEETLEKLRSLGYVE